MTHTPLAVLLLFLGSSPQTSGGGASPSPTPIASATPPIEGVRNYTRVDATIGCAGATEAKALPAIAKLGYKAVLNLREETEAGANIAEARAGASTLGLKYLHLPVKSTAPEAKTAAQFLELVTDPQNQPLFIHCGSGNRVAALWLIKRRLVDKWTEERAVSEAKALGLTSEALLKFALEYVARPTL
jgi:uncharacterized protein (TIGR01244 family)